MFLSNSTLEQAAATPLIEFHSEDDSGHLYCPVCLAQASMIWKDGYRITEQENANFKHEDGCVVLVSQAILASGLDVGKTMACWEYVNNKANELKTSRYSLLLDILGLTEYSDEDLPNFAEIVDRALANSSKSVT